MAEVENMILGILLVSAFLVGMAAFYVDAADDYSITVDDVSTQSSMEDLDEILGEMKGDLEQNPIDVDWFNAPMMLISGAWSAVRLSITALPLLGNMITWASGELGIFWLGDFLTMAVTIGFLFGIIKLARGQ